jgi:hypothetical protein
MPPRGRPRRPPRTDREEIKRNSDQWDEKVQAGLDAMFPIEPRPHPLTVEEIKSLFHAPSEEDLAAAAAKVHVAPTPPATESEVKFDRELTEQLRDAGAPLPPSWVLDAACEAFAAELDIAAARTSIDEAGLETLRTLKDVMSERIRDLGGLGVQVRLNLYLNGKERFRAFAATFPTPADYQDTFLGVFVPFYNATHGDRRRCIECGTVFALRTPAEVETSRYCSEECSARQRNRGRDKKHGGRSATEAKSTRAGERLIRHMKGCGACQTGRSCDTRERLLITDMSSPPIRFESQKPRRK